MASDSLTVPLLAFFARGLQNELTKILHNTTGKQVSTVPTSSSLAEETDTSSLVALGSQILEWLQASGGCREVEEARDVAGALLTGGVLQGTAPFSETAAYSILDPLRPPHTKPTGASSMSIPKRTGIVDSAAIVMLGRAMSRASSMSREEPSSSFLSSPSLSSPSLSFASLLSSATHQQDIASNLSAEMAAALGVEGRDRRRGHSTGRDSVAEILTAMFPGREERGGSVASPSIHLTVAIPATETRHDTAGAPFTVYVIRVAVSAGVAAAEGGDDSGPRLNNSWIVHRRYRQFEALHQALTRRYPYARIRTAHGTVSPMAASKRHTTVSLPRVSGDVPTSLVSDERKKKHRDAESLHSSVILPEFPSKSLTSVLSGGMGKDVVEHRRVKLENYLQQLVSSAGTWTVGGGGLGDEVVVFLDNEGRSLSQHVNMLRLLAAQRALTAVNLANVRRNRLMERKVTSTHATVKQLSEKLERMEALLTAKLPRSHVEEYMRSSQRGYAPTLSSATTLDSHSSMVTACSRPIVDALTHPEYFAAADANQASLPFASHPPELAVSAEAYVKDFVRGKNEKVDASDISLPQSWTSEWIWEGVAATSPLPAGTLAPGFVDDEMVRKEEAERAIMAAFSIARGAAESRSGAAMSRMPSAPHSPYASHSDRGSEMWPLVASMPMSPLSLADCPASLASMMRIVITKAYPMLFRSYLPTPTAPLAPTRRLNPDDFATAMVAGLGIVETGLHEILLSCCPTPASEAKRHQVRDYMAALVQSVLAVDCFVTGSSATRTYLPTSDIDMTIILPPGQVNGDWFIRLNEALCLASAAEPLEMGFGRPPLTVRNVSFINADVRLVRCTIDNITVDISANSAGALASATLIESADTWIGRDHLFKRSLLLLKVWFDHDSQEFNPAATSLLGSDRGFLSSHALATLLLAVFNTYDRDITTVAQAITAFFEEYAVLSRLDAGESVSGGDIVSWGNTSISLFGYQHVYLEPHACPALARASAPRFITGPMLRPLREFVAGGLVAHSSKERLLDNSCPPDVRSMNIRDPVAQWNNLAKAVSRKGVAGISAAILNGQNQWRRVLRAAQMHTSSTSEDSIRAPLIAMFPQSVSWYGRGDGWREDLLSHPLERGGAADRNTRLLAAPVPMRPQIQPGCSYGVLSALWDLVHFRELDYALSFCQTLTWPVITPALIVILCAQALTLHGPMAVGELGKLIAESSGSTRLPAVLKEKFGGLKKFLESHHLIFGLGTEHQFNPTVSLRWWS